jgi:hypothetical protein
MNGFGVSGHPIWAQHWSDPDQTQTRAHNVTLMSTTTTAAGRSARETAIACSTGQTEPLSERLAVVPAALIAWSVELITQGWASQRRAR